MSRTQCDAIMRTFLGGRSLSTSFRLSYNIVVQKPGGDGSVFVVLLRGRECKLHINFKSRLDGTERQYFYPQEGYG